MVLFRLSLFLFLTIVPFLVGAALLLSCAARYGPANDWRGLFRSPRFWGGWALMLFSVLYDFCFMFIKTGSIF